MSDQVMYALALTVSGLSTVAMAAALMTMAKRIDVLAAMLTATIKLMADVSRYQTRIIKTAIGERDTDG